MSEGDLPGLSGLLARAYPDATPEGMARRLAASLGRPEVASFVADEAGRPAGMVLANDYGASCYVALMGVEPALQRRGIGCTLMDALTAWIDRRRIPAELMATREGRGLYLRYGFRDAGEGEVWYGRAGEAPGLIEMADREAVRSLDREAFGVERGVALDRLLGDGDNAVFLSGDGFSVAQRVARVLGPVVAGDAATARRLLLAASAAMPEGELRVNAPSRPEVQALLREAGFRRDRSLTRMVRGEVPPGRRERIWVMLNLGQG